MTEPPSVIPMAADRKTAEEVGAMLEDTLLQLVGHVSGEQMDGARRAWWDAIRATHLDRVPGLKTFTFSSSERFVAFQLPLAEVFRLADRLATLEKDGVNLIKKAGASLAAEQIELALHHPLLDEEDLDDPTEEEQKRAEEPSFYFPMLTAAALVVSVICYKNGVAQERVEKSSVVFGHTMRRLSGSRGLIASVLNRKEASE